MGEKFTSKLKRQESFTKSKQETEKKPNKKQIEGRDFFYDPVKREILIYREGYGERKKERHPFQEFLYELRREEIKVSTSEWLDLQKVLAEGEIQNLDDFYIVARALLVKDVTGYPRFDTVFGRMFYGIEFPESQEEDQEDYEDYEDEEAEDQQEEREESEEENLSQEIVEPGFAEEHHGGEDVHKAIEDSKSSGHEGGGKLLQDEGEKSGKGQKQEGEGGSKREQEEGAGKKKESDKGSESEEKKETDDGKYKKKNKKEQGVIIKGKGGYSARERVIERCYDYFEKEQTLNYEQFGRALAKLISIIQESSSVPSGKLDEIETVKKIAQNAGLPELVWKEEQEKKSKVILIFDVGGSTDEFRPLMEKLFTAAKDYLDDVEIYYFHNAIYGEVWPQKDGNYGKNFIPLEEILKKDPDSKIIIIGDAWMAEDELWEDYVDYDNEGKEKYYPSGIDSFKRIRKTFEHVVWINPIPEREHDEWDESGTISDIKEVFNMYDLTLSGIEKAVKELMEN